MRIDFSQAALDDWHVLRPMLEAGQELYTDLDKAKEAKARSTAPKVP